MLYIKEIVGHFGKMAYLISCRELDEKSDSSLTSVCVINMKLQPAAD